MTKGGGLVPEHLHEGEQMDFPSLHVRPNQSILVNELKSKFEAID